MAPGTHALVSGADSHPGRPATGPAPVTARTPATSINGMEHDPPK